MIEYRFSFFLFAFKHKIWLKSFSLPFFQPPAKVRGNPFPNLKNLCLFEPLNLKNLAPQNLRILEPSKKPINKRSFIYYFLYLCTIIN